MQQGPGERISGNDLITALTMPNETQQKGRTNLPVKYRSCNFLQDELAATFMVTEKVPHRSAQLCNRTLFFEQKGFSAFQP
jgi:hypothetical protein